MAQGMIFLALTLCIAAASASRSPIDLLMKPWTSDAKSDVVQPAVSSRYGEGAYVNYKLTVPPALVSEFADKWDSYIGKPASRFRGNDRMVLTRPVVSNGLHYSYSEWTSMEAYACFSQSKNAQDFQAYLVDADIKYEIEFLVKPTESNQAVSPDAAEEVDCDRRSTFSVLTTVLLQPHNAEGFMSAFFNAEEATRRKNGNQAYALSRVITTNDKFYVYSAWNSEAAWRDHLESDHVKELAKYCSKHNIIYIETPLVTLIKY